MGKKPGLAISVAETHREWAHRLGFLYTRVHKYARSRCADSIPVGPGSAAHDQCVWGLSHPAECKSDQQMGIRQRFSHSRILSKGGRYVLYFSRAQPGENRSIF